MYLDLLVYYTKNITKHTDEQSQGKECREGYGVSTPSLGVSLPRNLNVFIHLEASRLQSFRLVMGVPLCKHDGLNYFPWINQLNLQSLSHPEIVWGLKVPNL